VTKRDYPSETLTVHWDSAICLHSGDCVRALRGVFDPRRTPWIDTSAADDEQIARAVLACPSGALTLTRYGEAAAAPPSAPATTTVIVEADGPLEVRGDLVVVDAEGHEVRRAQKLFLCRCGHSRNKPYCDGSHSRHGFRDPGLPPE
jgi:uncharacterized Fe-S cluster protein YjdI